MPGRAGAVETLLDALLLASLPAVLVGVFALPEPFRESLVFNYLEPTVVDAVASHFVHLGLEHLLANLVGYLLVAPLAYLLARVAGRRRQFRLVFVAVVLSLPAALSALNLAFVRPAVTFGASGLVMGFYGYLAFALLQFLDREVDALTTVRQGPLVFGAGAALIAGAVWTTQPTTAVVAATVVVTGLAYTEFRYRELARFIGTGFRVPGSAYLFIAGLTVFVSYPWAAFPPDPTGDASVLNLYTHLLGYCLAFLLVYVTAYVGVFNLVHTTADESGTLVK